MGEMKKSGDLEFSMASQIGYIIRVFINVVKNNYLLLVVTVYSDVQFV